MSLHSQSCQWHDIRAYINIMPEHRNYIWLDDDIKPNDIWKSITYSLVILTLQWHCLAKILSWYPSLESVESKLQLHTNDQCAIHHTILASQKPSENNIVNILLSWPWWLLSVVIEKTINRWTHDVLQLVSCTKMMNSRCASTGILYHYD